VTYKDLFLPDYSAQEAESVLNLYYLHLTTGKIVNYTLSKENAEYWPRRGVIIRDAEPETLIGKLLPYEGGQYAGWDGFIGGKSVLDAARKKPYDCFVSYFSGDKEFVRRLEQDLRFREIELWLDEHEIEVGDSISGKIEQGLTQSYTFMIVLSPEALSRAWVKEELRAAYSLRLGGELRILPVLHKECEIPPFLADYKYADFRDEKRYQEQISLLERSIKNAVKRAREKQ
jgi:TIR domain